MKFSKKNLKDPRVKEINKNYMNHPFIRGLGDGTLNRLKFENYLIQDSLYLKEYGKIYAHIFILANNISDLQFLHKCMGVIIADETNMHTKYLQDYNLDVYKIDQMEINFKVKMKSATREYLDYMFSFIKKGDIKEIFISILPCTIVYEYIGKSLARKYSDKIEDNYYRPWIEAYAGENFEEFARRSLEFLDSICMGIEKKKENKLIEIYLKACEFEMNFWDMSYE